MMARPRFPWSGGAEPGQQRQSAGEAVLSCHHCGALALSRVRKTQQDNNLASQSDDGVRPEKTGTESAAAKADQIVYAGSGREVNHPLRSLHQSDGRCLSLSARHLRPGGRRIRFCFSGPGAVFGSAYDSNVIYSASQFVMLDLKTSAPSLWKNRRRHHLDITSVKYLRHGLQPRPSPLQKAAPMTV